VDNSILGGFVERGGNGLQHFAGVILFPGIEESHETSFQAVQAGFDAVIVQLLSGAVAHAALGGFCIRHILAK
jgi:hypothetical protein